MRPRRFAAVDEAGARPGRATGPDPFSHPSTVALVAAALAEDIGHGDLTTAATVSATTRGRAGLVARDGGILAGLPLIEIVYRELATPAGPPIVRLLAQDGDRVHPGTCVGEISGTLAAILTGERVMLNFLMHLSGIATLTGRFVDRIAGTGATIVDTRKTLPGLRLLEKYAVRVAGGRNHRFGLDDGILIKDNHIAACGGVHEAVRRAQALAPHTLRVEVECDTLEEVTEAISAGADIILLDNFSAADVRLACQQIGRRAKVEVSGGVTLETVRELAEAGAELISVGRLTHSAPALDLGLDVTPGEAETA